MRRYQLETGIQAKDSEASHRRGFRSRAQSNGQGLLAESSRCTPAAPLPSVFKPSDQRLSRPPGHSLLQLQRSHGNRYVQRVLGLARSGEGEGDVTPEVESGIERARGGGQPLDRSVRRQMESAFGANFSGVRVHTGAEAHSLNRSVSAVAFTTGQDIFFSHGAYQPASSGGRELLAHELTHVVQQSGPGVQAKLTVSQPGDPLEREADQMAQAVVRDESQGVHRQAEVGDEEEKKKLHAKREGLQGQPEASNDDEEKKKKQAPG